MKHSQAFLSNRHITNNIRLVLDILDYSDLVHEDSFVMFLDFYKAFDSLEHGFIFEALKRFRYGQYFVNSIRTLFSNANCSIKLKYGTSPRYFLSRGVPQGSPVSPYVFLIAAQLFATFMSHNNLHGISIADREVKISQVADDTTLFFR